MAARIEKAHQQTVAEVGVLSSKVDEAISMARDALERIKSLSQKLVTDLEMGIIIISAVAAATMLGFGMAAFLFR